MEINWSVEASDTSSQSGISTNKIGNRASFLLVDPANSGHSGNYTCTVKNPVGVVNYTASLEIHGISKKYKMLHPKLLHEMLILLYRL